MRSSTTSGSWPPPGRSALSVTGSPSLTCAIDASTVARAIGNLLDNAVRCAPGGSTVTLDVRGAADHASVVVTDRGPGIPPDEQDRVFERFWRGRSDTRGTGLGLPIAGQIARAHGGDLAVRSPGPAGDGCVFTLTVRR